VNLRSLVYVALSGLLLGCSSSPNVVEEDEGTGGGSPGTGGGAAGAKADGGKTGGGTGTGGAKGTGGGGTGVGGGSTGSGGATISPPGGKGPGCGKAPTINPDTAPNSSWPYFSIGDTADAAKGLPNPQLHMQINGKDRTFSIFIPASGVYDQDTPIPLYFTFHGCGSGSSASGFIEAFGFGAIVIAPQGLSTSCGGSTTGWLNAKDSEDYDFFDAMVKWATEGFCVDMDKIFGSGHSHGGMFMGTLGCYRGNVFRAISPESASPQGQTGCVSQVAYLGLHHVADGVVSITGGEQLRDMYATANHCGTTTKPFAGFDPCVQYDGCDAAFPVYWCAITELPMIDSWSQKDVGAHNVWAWSKTSTANSTFMMALPPKP
jgi:poly(3-hydroxybutyrate) depolymerase